MTDERDCLPDRRGAFITRDFRNDLAHLCVGHTVSLKSVGSEWHFTIGSRIVLAGFMLWRLIGTDQIELSSEDNGHQFGLLVPINAEKRFNDMTKNALVADVSVSHITGDLRLDFDNKLYLQLITTSMGYESLTVWRDGEFFAAIANKGLA